MNIITLILFLLSLPVISSISVLLIKEKYKQVRELLLFGLALGGAVVVTFIALLYCKYDVEIINFNFIKFSHNIYISLQIEPLTLLFIGLISVLWPLTLIYSFNYFKNSSPTLGKINEKYFYFFLCLSIGATLGIALSGNLITTFIFYETLTLLTYPLIIGERTKEAEKAGKTYLGILVCTSMLLFLPAIILIYIYTGSVNYTSNGLFFSSTSKVTSLIFLMFMFGVSKAALMPFHAWLPKAMVAPAPVSALLHAVAVVKSGVFILIKIVIYIFGIDYLSQCVKEAVGFNAFLIIPAITLIIASFINLFQDKLKKLLAYSTISQLSYIICCILLFKPIAIVAACACFLAHALAKIVLFFQAGCFIKFLGTDSISHLAGIGKAHRLPIITSIGAFNILSLLNLPFTFGFAAKFYLLQTVIVAENYWILIVIAISFTLSVIYFSKVLYVFYFSTPNKIVSNIPLTIDAQKLIEEPIAYMTIILFIISMINILLFFSYDDIVQIIKISTIGV